MNAVKEFYDQLQFPGHYTQQQLAYHDPEIRNDYLAVIDRHLQHANTVLDVGCGTGLIANLFAGRYPNKQFTAVDFADSVNYARNYAVSNSITNVTYQQQDFLDWRSEIQYDAVLCQGVLHHIPEYVQAAAKLSDLVNPGGVLILAVYHPWGKILKKFVNLNYKNDILYRDQELVPWETAFNLEQVCELFPEFQLKDSYPQQNIQLNINIKALLNYRNGGLSTYVLEKRHVKENI